MTKEIVASPDAQGKHETWIGMKGTVKADGDRLIFVTDKMWSIRVNTAEELMKVKEELSVSGLLDGMKRAGPVLPPEH
jgi:hypothetical protein